MIEIAVFAVASIIAVAGALGMATTMSMFRSGIFLMASFIGVAALFVLLAADLLGLLQVMMYVGGMLVMILFMVLFSHDPGGAMMAEMDGLAPPERFFSLGLKQRLPHGAGGRHEDQHEHEHHGMDMSMVTPARRAAAWLGAAAGAVLVGLLIAAPDWPQAPAAPDPDSARQVGMLLMGKYMLAFEGAALLILTGIFGAVLLARTAPRRGRRGRALRAAENENPAPAAPDSLPPLGENPEAAE